MYVFQSEQEYNGGENFNMNPNQNTLEDEIDLLLLARLLLNRIWFILAATVVGGIIAFSYAKFFITPLYEAKAMMYVNNTSISVGSASFSISTGELSAAQKLVDTYGVILKSRMTLETVIQKANLPYTYEELYDMISTGSVNDTQIFEIKVTDSNPEEAELIANTVADILPAKIASIVDGSSVRIVDYAVVPAEYVSPSVAKYTAIGLVLGAVLCSGVIIIMELLNETIRSEDYLLQTYDLPILAVIPTMEAGGSTHTSRQKKEKLPTIKRGGK